MAWIRRRGAHYQVGWRQDDKQTSQSFEDESLALAFKAILEAEGSESAFKWLHQRGIAQGENDDTMTLDAWMLNHYIPGLTGITDGTRHDYERIYKMHWSKPLGAMLVDDTSLKRARITAVVNDMAVSSAPKTIANWHGILSAGLQAAAEDTDIPLTGNPCRGIRLPSGESDDQDDVHEMTCLSPAQFAALYEQVPEHWRPLVLTLYGTGARWGEATALQVRDVDLAAARLRIRRAWKRGPAGRPVAGAPKHNSRRTITLTRELVAALRPLVKNRATDDLIFTGPSGGVVANRRFHELVWGPTMWRLWRCEGHRTDPNPKCVPDCVRRDGQPSWCKIHQSQPAPCGCDGTLNIDPRVHDLRHSHASWLIANKIPLPAISRRLGHKSISITVDVYGHLMQESQDEISAAISSGLAGLALTD